MVPTPSRRTTIEKEIHALCNEARKDQELHALCWHPELSQIAHKHAVAVADGKAPFSHEGALDRFRQCQSRCINMAENLARTEGFGRADIAQAIVNGWKQSEGHYKNLCGPFNAAGIGWAASEHGAIFVTQLLALVEDLPNDEGPVDALKTQAVQAATSTPAVLAALGLLVAGPFAMVGGGVIGSALEHSLGIRAKNAPIVARNKALRFLPEAMWRHTCSRCQRFADDRGLFETQGELLCHRCCPTMPGGSWCFVE